MQKTKYLPVSIIMILLQHLHSWVQGTYYLTDSWDLQASISYSALPSPPQLLSQLSQQTHVEILAM